VHRLYAPGGAAVAPMQAAFPDAIEDGAVSRDRLKTILVTAPDALKKIEAIVHPLVAQDRADFLRTTTADIAVLDIPLLYETGGDAQMDAVACVTIPADIQRQRVLDRGNMSADQFEAILAKQMPNTEKCARADYEIETDTIDHARDQVKSILRTIREQLNHA
jgi:dephospho-CoA kinase